MKPITVVELIVTYISLGWAYALLTTPDLFERSENFNKLQSLVNYEWVVGFIVLVCAGVKVVGIALGKRRMRSIGLLMSAVFWIVVAASFLVAVGRIEVNTGFVVYSGIAVMSLWNSKEVMRSGGAE